jgi:hypothetical protein
MKVQNSGGPRFQPVQTSNETRQPARTETASPARTDGRFQADRFETPQAGANKNLVALGRTQQAQPPGPQPVGTPGTPITSNTRADYTSGPPQRPNIRHDNGFLQNPNNPNDPNPIATVPPTAGDYVQRGVWEAKLRAGYAGQGVPFVPHNNIQDGLEAYDHFLHGGGRDRQFSYESFVRNDPSGQTILRNATRDTQLAAQGYYQQLVARDPSLANKPVTFQITGSGITVGGPGQFPYPATENWQKAIGGHTLWNSATVTVHPPETPGGQPRFEMQMTLHAEDRYNFNPGQADIAMGTPDAENGRFEQTGLAHQYTQYATLQRNVTWNQGSPENATSSPVGGR